MVASQSNVTSREPSQTGALNFLRLLWEIQHGLLAVSRRMRRDIGVTGPQRLVLRLLSSTPGITAGELAQALHLDKSTLTGIVGRLERDGFLRRAVDPLDRRRQLLALTRKARSVAATLSGTVEERVADALAEALPEEVVSAEKILSLVTESLERSSKRSARKTWGGPRKEEQRRMR
jgi:DNA-binding MarR family transcriptional regulator